MNPILYFGAVFAGAIAGLAFDPVVILAAVAVGAASRRWWHTILAALALSIVLSIAIRFSSQLSSGTPIW